MWSWFAGITSVITLFLMGLKWKWAPIFGLVCQSFWFIYVFVDKQWGLLLCVIAYTGVHIYNSFRWLRKE